MSTLKAILTEVDFFTFVIWVFAIIEGVNLVTKGVDAFCTRFGIENKRKRESAEFKNTVTTLATTTKTLTDSLSELTEQINMLKESDTKIETKLDKLDGKFGALENATMEDLYDTINRKCKYYMYSVHGIPSDEKEAFKRLTEAYTRCGGNHGLQDKVKTCLDTLPTINMARELKERN